MKRMNVFVLVVIFLFQAGLSFSEEMSPFEIAKRLQKTYDQTSTMIADFSQTTMSKMSSREKKGHGVISLAKPGKMRWDYLEPDRQVFVCDGRTISMYFAKEKQMVVSPAEQYLESDVTYSFFAGSGNLIRDFNIARIPAPAEETLDDFSNDHRIKIIPKEGHSQVDFINLWADRVSFLLRKIEVTDKFGSVTSIAFSNIKRNVDVDGKIFSFDPPPGTELVKQ